MYALKRITVTVDGRHVEESRVLGNMYRLQFHPDNPTVAASIEYAEDDGIPTIEIYRADEAYITTINGDTVRSICRGDLLQRETLAAQRSGGFIVEHSDGL
ncbi:hypothetical protein [Enterobacter hormaechei]|uniref:hypothetical protein n=1 Tax=Enterobacter hormaechei TaxID=158836 RepID=UPI002A74DFD0|nr:hypothetical protein [Enterobacter hormaechei]MDY3572329.1 hypothetical protein [Enterobacter hormaechei]